ncbi:hypothetical protein ACFS4T_33640 [Pseudomonas lini]
MPFSDIVAVSGLLLTLTTFMFNLAWPRLHEALELDEKNNQVRRRENAAEERFFWCFTRLRPTPDKRLHGTFLRQPTGRH